MANITSVIESFLMEMLGNDDRVVINRNQLAGYFDCAPSQINYVLTTRFTVDRGFIIESQRGSGGSMTLIRINDRTYKKLSKIVDLAAGEGLSYQRAKNIIDRMQREKLINEDQAGIIKTVINDKSLMVPAVLRDHLRANLLKNIINYLLKGE